MNPKRKRAFSLSQGTITPTSGLLKTFNEVTTTDVSDGIADDLFLNFADGLKPNKMSIAQLKKLDGFTDISDELALQIIDELYKLSVITYGLLKQNFNI